MNLRATGKLIIQLLGLAALQAAELNILRETVVDSSALNYDSADTRFSQNVNGRSFQRFPMSSFKGYQYTTYYDSNRNVAVGRRQLPDSDWQVIRLTDYTMPGSDSHNFVSIGICQRDGTIHLAFDLHADPLNYRVSDLGVASNPESVVWSPALFNDVTDELGSLGRLPSVTYPSFFNAPNGNLMLYYRFQGSGSGDGMIHEYDGTTHDWTPGMGKFIARTGSYSGTVSTNSTTRNPYINGISYAGNRLHASWGWRESAGGSSNNHDLNYAYSDDDGRTWNNSAGTRIGTTNSSFITIDSPGLLVASIPQNIGLSNQYTHHAYPDGSCHVMVAHNQTGTTTKRYHHYWRDAAGTWSSESLPFTGSRPKLVGDDDRSLFLAYASGGILRIAKGTPNATNTSWSWSTIHSQSNTTEGGEGQIDYTRWETERILSVYGQASPNATGDPTPLSVFDYQVSAKAILPTPLNTQEGVAESSPLSWSAGIGAVSHRIYLGTDPDAVATADTSSPEYLGEPTSTVFTPTTPLLPTTTYYWRVDEIDEDSEVHQGLLWSFTTAGNFPPTISEIPDQSHPLGDPVEEIPFIIGDDNVAHDSLLLTAASSNTSLVPQSGLAITGTGSNRMLQVAHPPDQTGTSIITITVDDGVHQTGESFNLTITDPIYQLFSNSNDSSIRDAAGTLEVVDAAKSTTLLGTGGSTPKVDRCTVYVFQLPEMGTVSNPFKSASLGFGYTAKQGTLHSNDLYGIGRRATPAVLASDYHGKTSTIDPDASLLQTGILTNASAFGVTRTSSSGADELLDFLNSEYASGAGAGQFVFLRLNTAGYQDNTIDRATLTMSEGASVSPVDTRPRISITTDALTGLQKWRAQYFTTPVNAGDGADDADPNFDDESNLLEFVSGQNPHAATLSSTALKISGAEVDFTYTRSTAALADGFIFEVEWSDTLLPDSWSRSGVTETIDLDDGFVQTVIATVPADNTAQRFVRLKASLP